MEVVDLSNDSELSQRVQGVHGSERYKAIQTYILNVLSDQPIQLSDGKRAVVDRSDALHIANKSGTEKAAQIAKIKELVENAVRCAEDTNAKHDKFDYFCYYETVVKYDGDTYPIYVNVERAKNDGQYHIYDITKKLRDTANRINGLERPKPNEGYALKNDVSMNSIPQSPEKSTPLGDFSLENISEGEISRRLTISPVCSPLPALRTRQQSCAKI